MRAAAILVAAVVAGAATRAEAQRVLSVTGARGLSFGTIVAGAPAIVSSRDVALSGRFDLRGNARAEIRADFVLPGLMTGPSGRTMPITFGPADGAHNTANNPAAATQFDLRLPLITRLAASGRLYIFVGGTASPALSQVAGSYTATITVNVVYTGN